MNIYLQDVQRRIDENPEKTRLLLKKYGIETPLARIEEVAQAHVENPKFLQEFYSTTSAERNANDVDAEQENPAEKLSWTIYGGAVADALSALFGSINSSKNADQNAAMQTQALKTQQAIAEAESKKSSTTIMVIGVIVLVVVIGVIVYLTKKK